MAYSGNTGITRLVKALGYSWQGLKACITHEAAFRQELFLAVVLTPFAIWISSNMLQLALLLSSLLLLLIVEILNSAIEAVVDRFGDEQHELSGRAKDMASAAVLLAIMYLLLVWGLILWQNVS